MIVFGCYRLWFTFVPLLVSLQLAWRADEQDKEASTNLLLISNDEKLNLTHSESTTNAPNSDDEKFSLASNANSKSKLFTFDHLINIIFRFYWLIICLKFVRLFSLSLR